MIIRMELRGPQLVIEDIEVEMPTIPHDMCAETLKSLEPVKAMAIVSGFNIKGQEAGGRDQGMQPSPDTFDCNGSCGSSGCVECDGQRARGSRNLHALGHGKIEKYLLGMA